MSTTESPGVRIFLATPRTRRAHKPAFLLRMTDDLFRRLGSGDQGHYVSAPDICAAKLSSILAGRRLLAIRRSALLSALGALGQRIERRVLLLIMLTNRACSSVT